MLQCPICYTACQTYALGTDWMHVMCARCGRYSASSGAITALRDWSTERRARFGARVRAASDLGSDLAISMGNLIAFALTYASGETDAVVQEVAA